MLKRFKLILSNLLKLLDIFELLKILGAEGSCYSVNLVKSNEAIKIFWILKILESC